MMKKFLAILPLALVGGCISLVPPANKLPPRYTLDVLDVEPSGEKLPVTLAVADARAEGALNTSRIAVLTAPNELRYLPDAEWSDRAPRIFSLLLERSFEERGRLLAVSDRVALPVADYVIYADMQAFNIDRNVEPYIADVEFRVRLETRRGRVLGASGFSAERTVSSREITANASAISEAAAQATSEAADWALELIAEEQATRS